MPHDRDIRGEPWAPCDVCPRDDPGACPSRRSRNLCALMADHPDGMRGRIRALPPEDGEPVEREAKDVGAPPPLPTLWKRIAHLAEDLGGAARHTLKTRELVRPRKHRRAYLSVCRTGATLPPDQVRDGHCDLYNVEHGACSVCGCVMRIKVQHPAWRCQVGRWAAMKAKLEGEPSASDDP